MLRVRNKGPLGACRGTGTTWRFWSAVGVDYLDGPSPGELKILLDDDLFKSGYACGQASDGALLLCGDGSTVRGSLGVGTGNNWLPFAQLGDATGDTRCTRDLTVAFL